MKVTLLLPEAPKLEAGMHARPHSQLVKSLSDPELFNQMELFIHSLSLICFSHPVPWILFNDCRCTHCHSCWGPMEPSDNWEAVMFVSLFTGNAVRAPGHLCLSLPSGVFTSMTSRMETEVASW